MSRYRINDGGAVLQEYGDLTSYTLLTWPDVL